MSTTKKMPNLDALRAFLAFLVVLSHLPRISKTLGLPAFDNLPIFHKGYNAVWVFFALSGYLIINLLYKEKVSNNTVSVKKFYGRRILRIYPVYYLVLIFATLFYYYGLPAINIEQHFTLSEVVLWSVCLMPNMLFPNPDGIFLILWSIGIEEQFYLMIAPLTKVVKTKWFAGVLLIFTYVYFLIYFNPYFTFFSYYHFLFFYFSMGGFLAILNQQGKINFLLFNKPWRLILYLVFAIYFTTDIFEFNSESLRHAFTLIIFPLFILNISNETEIIIKNRFLNYLGKISYGIYMYHLLVIYAVLFIGMKFDLASLLGDTGAIVLFNFATFAITIPIAHFSYFYFEKHFLKMKKR